MEAERTCVGCEGNADMTVNIIAYRLGSSPKIQTSTKSIGVCSECVVPGNPHYDKLGKVMACWLMQVNNDLNDRARAAAVDRKSAAGGA